MRRPALCCGTRWRSGRNGCRGPSPELVSEEPPMRSSRVRRLAAVSSLALLAAMAPIPAYGQAPAPSFPNNAQPPADQAPASLFGERIEVRVVNVEVVVTDRSGNKVQGLTAADFRLRVDGKDVPIEYFTEVRGGDAVAPVAVEGQETVKGLPSLAPGTPVGTSYLVFVDDYFSITQRRDEVLRALKDDLARLGPEDRMAIVAYDGRKLDMLSSWTGSQLALSHALTAAMRRPAHGLERVAELRSFESSRRTGLGVGTARNPRGAFFDRLDLEELSYARRLTDQLGKSVAAAASTLRGFASPPGRKVMLLLDGGWPFNPGDYVVNNLNRPIMERELPPGDKVLAPLADTANLLGYTVYPVDVEGLDVTGADASRQTAGSTNLFPVRQQEIHATLDFVARQTGGKPLLSRLRTAASGTAAQDTRAYYWMGFTATRKGDNARHGLTVEVKRAGLKARFRDSFRDLSREGEGAMMVESAMLFSSPRGSEKLPIELGEVARSGRHEIEVPLSVAIPASAITTVPIAGKYAAELELRVAALDVDGNRSEVPMVGLKLQFEKPP